MVKGTVESKSISRTLNPRRDSQSASPGTPLVYSENKAFEEPPLSLSPSSFVFFSSSYLALFAIKPIGGGPISFKNSNAVLI